MKEELVLVERFEELRAGMLVVVKPCGMCDAEEHRGILVRKWLGSWAVLPVSHSEDGAQSFVSIRTVERGALYRVVDGREVPADAQERERVRAE